MKKLILLTLLISTSVKAISIEWDNTTTNTNIVTEIWSSVDLINWSLKAEMAVPQTNYIINNPINQEFFKIRYRDTIYIIYSVWAHNL